jgi:large subunit ribosomal protein L30
LATKKKNQIKVTLKKSTICCPQDQKDTVRALGLRKINTSVIKEDNPAIRGQIFKVKHLVSTEEA